MLLHTRLCARRASVAGDGARASVDLARELGRDGRLGMAGAGLAGHGGGDAEGLHGQSGRVR